MDDDEFEQNRSALITQYLERPKQLCSLASCHWGQIRSQMYHFDSGMLKKFATFQKQINRHNRSRCTASTQTRTDTVIL
jgi:hypothetical protein